MAEIDERAKGIAQGVGKVWEELDAKDKAAYMDIAKVIGQNPKPAKTGIKPVSMFVQGGGRVTPKTPGLTVTKR